MKLGKYRHYKAVNMRWLVLHFTLKPVRRWWCIKPLGALPDDVPGFGEDASWVRPKKVFEETVMMDGEEVPRFQFLS